MKLPVGCYKNDNDEILCVINGKEKMMKSCEWHLGINSVCKDFENNEYSFSDRIFIIDMAKENKMETKTYGIIKEGVKRIHAFQKDLYLAGKMGDLGNTGDKMVIASMFLQTLPVKKIEVKKDAVFIDACEGESPLAFSKDLDIYYEPWFMDRGSFVFINPKGNEYPEGQLLKIATEGDILTGGMTCRRR
jgi:hypothetical protein